MHLPEIDRYAHLDSPLHRWDPRARLATLGVLLLVVVFAPHWPVALLGLASSLVLLQLSRIPPSFVFVHVKWVLALCAFLVLIMALTAGGEPLLHLGPFAVSRDGLSQSGLISVRAVAAVLLVYPMLGTSRFHVSMKALQRLGVPRVAVQILAFSYRYAFVLFDELSRMLTAARARGLERARGLRTLRNFGNLVGMLFVRSYNRTGRVHRAMLARGYRGEAYALEEFRLGRADVARCVAGGALVAVLAAAGVLL